VPASMDKGINVILTTPLKALFPKGFIKLHRDMKMPVIATCFEVMQ